MRNSLIKQFLKAEFSYKAISRGNPYYVVSGAIYKENPLPKNLLWQRRFFAKECSLAKKVLCQRNPLPKKIPCQGNPFAKEYPSPKEVLQGSPLAKEILWQRKFFGKGNSLPKKILWQRKYFAKELSLAKKVLCQRKSFAKEP